MKAFPRLLKKNFLQILILFQFSLNLEHTLMLFEPSFNSLLTAWCSLKTTWRQRNLGIYWAPVWAKKHHNYWFMILLAAPPTDIFLVFSHESVILRREEHIQERVATVVIFAGSVGAGGERFKRPSPRSYSSKPLEARPDLFISI